MNIKKFHSFNENINVEKNKERELFLFDFISSIDKTILEMIENISNEHVRIGSRVTYKYSNRGRKFRTVTNFMSIMKRDINDDNIVLNLNSQFILKHEIIFDVGNAWESNDGINYSVGHIESLKDLPNKYKKLSDLSGNFIESIVKLNENIPYLKIKRWGISPPASFGFSISLESKIPHKLVKQIISQKTLVDRINKD